MSEPRQVVEIDVIGLDEDEPCGCDVHPRWCAWNGASCDHCTRDTTFEARRG